MPTYSRQLIRTTRVEYAVPAPPPFGACWSDVSRAIAAIHQELVNAGRLEEGEDAGDDVIRVEPRDDHIIVSYLAETTQDTT